MVAHPHSDSLSTIPDWNRNLKVLVFEEKGKPEYPKKNLSEQRREPTTNCGQPTYGIGAWIWSRHLLEGGWWRGDLKSTKEWLDDAAILHIEKKKLPKYHLTKTQNRIATLAAMPPPYMYLRGQQRGVTKVLSNNLGLLEQPLGLPCFYYELHDRLSTFAEQN